MTQMIGKQNLAIHAGIKAVGVGKKGSKSLTPQLIEQIIVEFNHRQVSDILKGAFFAGLFMKGPTREEMRLDAVFDRPILGDPEALAKQLCNGAPNPIKVLCSRLLKRKELNKAEALELGRFLMSHESGDAARGLVASLLRVRYETQDEYEGLLKSITETFEPPFKSPLPPGPPVISIAEPFDGVDHSYLQTPLLAEELQRMAYRVVCLVGRNSGPKYGNNLLDLASALNASFLKDNADMSERNHPHPWYLDQRDLSKAMDRWVDLRREIIKRPFLATLERFVNPCQSRILIASAFHPPYGEKMLSICERAGIPGGIIIRNGLEGTTAFALMRLTRILCTSRQSDGNYVRREIIMDPKEFLEKPIEKEERLIDPDLEKNVELIKAFRQKGKTDYDLFNKRIKVTCAGIKKAIKWVESILEAEEHM